MLTYETESGYLAKETLSGIDIYDSDSFICELAGRKLDDYMDENENIDDNALDDDISMQLQVDDFIEYQQEYC